MQVYNGMPADALDAVTWRATVPGNPGGACVELARLPGSAGIALRNSRHPEGPVLIYTLEEIAAFLDGARKGEFDHLLR